MSLLSNQAYLLSQQYQNASNLDARIQLHLRFSTNPYGWQRWMFDRLLELPENARLLELGCGSARLWAENRGRIPPGWEVTLSDFSPGMLAQATQNLAESGRTFHFEQVDAQMIPFGNQSCDAVIANHMLYHVPDLPRALAEIRRVLKPGGKLFAATNGAGHLRELDDLVRQFDPRLEFMEQTALKFTLENGRDQLAPYFAAIHLQRYPDSLVITEAAPLVTYVFSMMRISIANSELKEKFPRYIEDTLTKNDGKILIGKDAGLFVAHKE